MKKARLTEEQIIGILQEHGEAWVRNWFKGHAERREVRRSLRQARDVGRRVLCLEGEVFGDDGI
jgi:hypothetical protein